MVFAYGYFGVFLWHSHDEFLLVEPAAGTECFIAKVGDVEFAVRPGAANFVHESDRSAHVDLSVVVYSLHKVLDGD